MLSGKLIYRLNYFRISNIKKENIVEEEKSEDTEEKIGFFQRLFGKNK